MKIIEDTKAYLGKRSIQSLTKNTNRQAITCSVTAARSIGILFDATHMVNFEIVKELAKNISTKNNTVEVLGYVDSKQLIDHYLYRKGFEFYTRNELNWYYKPITPNVEKFIETPFDLLIDLSLDHPFPIKYVLACSRAKFKSGRFSPDQEYLDFMIDIEKEKETMSTIKAELEKDRKSGVKNGDVERIVDGKIQTEIQLNFLINQLLHYLSLMKN